MEMFQSPVFCLILIQIFPGPAVELAASEPEGEHCSSPHHIPIVLLQTLRQPHHYPVTKIKLI